MTAIALGISFFAVLVVILVVAFAVITQSIRLEEACWTFSAAAPTRAARMTRRVLGAYCDPARDWQNAPLRDVMAPASRPDEGSRGHG